MQNHEKTTPELYYTSLADRCFSILIKRVSSIIYVFIYAALILNDNLPKITNF